ncbi:restriction endonuclease [Demequina sp. SYSU T00039]|uniref:Restriction endonuclease n=1 Tax=Demequina lignilytica TaxID=3051663 RepID=A0AAW7M1V5_9MICO|nr:MULTISPECIES: restriction endonuclease [unclassified Demequina]MDN4477311.1 restriction endonuclease [Demequina sp. SYSU T00039-1]MDN4487484.1 restriction endonuclease [Demequina sp. SYSU T00039]
MPTSTDLPFELHADADLVIDAVYLGGTSGNAGDDPINKLLSVGNVGGFRPLGSVTKQTVRYVVLYTSGIDPDWPDELDPRTGIFVYHGDQKTPGRALHDTPRKGNILLRDIFANADGGPQGRSLVPPIFLFEKASPGRSAAFRGLLVPGGAAIRPDERLVAVWKSAKGQRYQNYRAMFTVLDVGIVSRDWLADLTAGHPLTDNAPKPWLNWIRTGAYQALTAVPNATHRTRDEQLPSDAVGKQMLAAIKSYFEDEPTEFEHCAAQLWQMMSPAVSGLVVTRASVDGGRDAIGSYGLGPVSDRIELTFSLEAKCYAPDTVVGVKQVSRLISRIKHREFGVFVTTSYVGQQAYKEIREDGHPVVVISGRDIVDLLRERGFGTVDAVRDWLRGEFPRGAED